MVGMVLVFAFTSHRTHSFDGAGRAMRQTIPCALAGNACAATRIARRRRLTKRRVIDRSIDIVVE